jgi:hypothetical protein
MADYHPLIARAVGGLEKDTAENRRVLYERARMALVAQLRGTVPALDESEITRERLALEEAIRKVEVESARRAREAPRPDAAAAKRAAQAVRREEAARPPAAAPSSPDRTPTIAPVVDASDSARDKPAAQSDVPAGLWPQSEHASLLDEALQEFREVAGGSESQGEPARAERSAHPIRPASIPAAPIPVAPIPAPPFLTPLIPAIPISAAPIPAVPTPPLPTPQQFAVQPPHQTPPLQPSSPPPLVQPPYDPLQELEALMPGVSREVWRTQPAEQVRPMPNFEFDDLGPKTPPQQSFRQAEEQERLQAPRSLRSYRRLSWILIVLLAVVGIGSLGYWQGNDMIQAARSALQSFRGPTTQTQKGTTPSQQKITDRIGQPATSESSTSGSSVTQRAMLTTEPDASNPRGRDYVGTANWRIETIPAGPGRAAEVAIKLEVEIPDRGLAMTWLIRRNTDPTLPASHTIDIEFNLAPNSPLGKIAEIRSLLMKQPGQVEGAPLWGHAQKSTSNYFLVGLSAVEADAQYNLKLLKEQPAFDVALVFSNVRRAFLLVEKGPVGERVFADAFAAWKQ